MNKNLDNLDQNVITIGVVGYPNVGKSSLINVLCKKKLVGVGAMPGKTKHF
jgi:large subunit GTPase 1